MSTDMILRCLYVVLVHASVTHTFIRHDGKKRRNDECMDVMYYTGWYILHLHTDIYRYILYSLTSHKQDFHQH